MESKRLSRIDKVFLFVIAGVFALGFLVQTGYSFSGEDNTFGIDPTGEGYIEVHDVNISRDWFRGLVNVTDTILGIHYDLIPDAADTYDLGSIALEWNDIYLGTGRVHFWTDQGEYIYSDSGALVFGVGGSNEASLSASSLTPTSSEGNALGSPVLEWADLYLGTGRVYFWTDQGESINSDGSNLYFKVGSTDQMIVSEDTVYVYGDLFLIDGAPKILITDTGEVSPLGKFLWRNDADLMQFEGRNAADNTWEDIITIERVADGGLVRFMGPDGISIEGNIAGTDSSIFLLTSGEKIAGTNTDNGFMTFEIRDNGVGRVEVGRLQGGVDPSFELGGSQEFKVYESGLLEYAPSINNTGYFGSDPARIANIYATTITGKSLVTGRVIETEISPAPWESFEEGDVVKIYDSDYFVKSNKVLDQIIGVVANNPEQVIDHYDITWEMVAENITHEDQGWELIKEEYQVSITYEVEYLRNITDMYNNMREIVEIRNENVFEYYIEEVEYELSDGSKIKLYFNQSRPVYETKVRYYNESTTSIWYEIVYNNVTTERAVYKDEGSPVLCVAGKTRVKISEPVLKNDILVAGSNGKARPFRTVLTQIKAQYSGIPFNWNNVITVMEAFTLRMIGQVMEDSTGSYCWVFLW